MKRFILLALAFSLNALLACSSLQNPTAVETDEALEHFEAPEPLSKEEAARLNALLEDLRRRAAERRIKLAKRTPAQMALHGSKITVPDDYPTIQEAVDAAAPGTKIKIKTGTYAGDVIVVADDIELTCEGEVTVDGTIYYQGVSDGSINKLTLETGLGIWLDEAEDVEVEDNIFGATEYGVHLINSANCQIKGNLIENAEFGVYADEGDGGHRIEENTMISARFGVYLSAAGEDNEISGNSIAYTGSARGLGITLDETDHSLVKDNVILDQTNTWAVFLTSAANNKVGSDNQLNNNLVGVIIQNSFDNLIKKNEITGNGNCDIVQASGSNTFKKNEADCTLGL